MKNKEGWDGKLRVEPKAVLANPEALEDSDYSDPEAPPAEEIHADEGKSHVWPRASGQFATGRAHSADCVADLLVDEDVNAEVWFWFWFSASS